MFLTLSQKHLRALLRECLRTTVCQLDGSWAGEHLHNTANAKFPLLFPHWVFLPWIDLSLSGRKPLWGLIGEHGIYLFLTILLDRPRNAYHLGAKIADLQKTELTETFGQVWFYHCFLAEEERCINSLRMLGNILYSAKSPGIFSVHSGPLAGAGTLLSCIVSMFMTRKWTLDYVSSRRRTISKLMYWTSMKSSLVKVNYHSNTVRSAAVRRVLNTWASVCLSQFIFPHQWRRYTVTW